MAATASNGVPDIAAVHAVTLLVQHLVVHAAPFATKRAIFNCLKGLRGTIQYLLSEEGRRECPGDCLGARRYDTAAAAEDAILSCHHLVHTQSGMTLGELILSLVLQFPESPLEQQR